MMMPEAHETDRRFHVALVIGSNGAWHNYYFPTRRKANDFARKESKQYSEALIYDCALATSTPRAIYRDGIRFAPAPAPWRATAPLYGN
jgi:hypothetical protein